MGKQRKVWSAEQKLLTIVLSVLKEQMSMAELCRQYGVAESLVHREAFSRAYHAVIIN